MYRITIIDILMLNGQPLITSQIYKLSSRTHSQVNISLSKKTALLASQTRFILPSLKIEINGVLSSNPNIQCIHEIDNPPICYAER